jgi:hypothetical protein
MLEDPARICPPAFFPQLAAQRRYIDFIDQVAEERRFRQDFGVEE